MFRPQKSSLPIKRFIGSCFCLTIFLGGDVYAVSVCSYGQVECKSNEYYPGNNKSTCAKCSNIADKDHNKCKYHSSTWCANKGIQAQGLESCSDVVNMYKKQYQNGVCVVTEYYLKGKQVMAWDTKDVMWFIKDVQSQWDVPAGAAGAENVSLNHSGWVKASYLKAFQQTFSDRLKQDGNTWYLPYNEVLDSKGTTQKFCPEDFFAFGGELCISKSDKTKTLTAEQIDSYNNNNQNDNDTLPDITTGGDNSTVSSSSSNNSGSSDFQYVNLPQLQQLPTVNFQSPYINTSFTMLQIKCKKGEVWFNQQCTPCTANPLWIQYAKEARVFCPGGDDLGFKKLVEQLQVCSAGARPNANLDGCECMYGATNEDGSCASITITQDQLRCGPNGCSVPKEQQCWTRTTKESYKKCMGF